MNTNCLDFISKKMGDAHFEQKRFAIGVKKNPSMWLVIHACMIDNIVSDFEKIESAKMMYNTLQVRFNVMSHTQQSTRNHSAKT